MGTSVKYNILYLLGNVKKQIGPTAELPMSRGNSVTYVLGTRCAIAYNESHVCDVALSPTRAKGHVAERRAAAPRSPRRLPRRRCTYALLYAVAPTLFLFITDMTLHTS